MRLAADWQVLLDDRILELLEEEDDFMLPSEIANDRRMHYSAQYVGDRCRKLAEHGLLRKVGRGAYGITEEGRGYLDEEYDVGQGCWVDKNPAESMGIQGESEETNGV
jgi:predicted transcriptional regulator